MSRCVATVATTALERAASHKGAAEPRERNCAAHDVLLPSHAQLPKTAGPDFSPIRELFSRINTNEWYSRLSFVSVSQAGCVCA